MMGLHIGIPGLFTDGPTVDELLQIKSETRRLQHGIQCLHIATGFILKSSERMIIFYTAIFLLLTLTLTFDAHMLSNRKCIENFRYNDGCIKGQGSFRQKRRSSSKNSIVSKCLLAGNNNKAYGFDWRRCNELSEGR